MKTYLALVALVATVSPSAHAAPYTLVIYEAPGQLALRPATDEAAAAYWAAYDVYGKQLPAARAVRGGRP